MREKFKDFTPAPEIPQEGRAKDAEKKEDNLTVQESKRTEVASRLTQADRERVAELTKEIKRTTFSPAEEGKLFERIRGGDIEARNKVVEANMPLVHWWVKKIVNRGGGWTEKGTGLEVGDLISYGYEGLIRATEKFEPEGARFSTYASRYIFGYIMTGIKKEGRAIRVPARWESDYAYLSELSDAMQMMNPEREKPSFDELLERAIASDEKRFSFAKKLTQLQKETYRSREMHRQPPKSLEEGITIQDAETIETRSIAFGERIADPFALAELEEPVFREKLRQDINDVLEASNLFEREREVIKLRFGLATGERETYALIGVIFNRTEQRVRQIEKKALRKLANPIRSWKLREYIDDF